MNKVYWYILFALLMASGLGVALSGFIYLKLSVAVYGVGAMFVAMLGLLVVSEE